MTSMITFSSVRYLGKMTLEENSNIKAWPTSRFNIILSYCYIIQERVSNVRYNIINGLSTPVRDASAPVYITIGDGGNVEGIANK